MYFFRNLKLDITKIFLELNLIISRILSTVFARVYMINIVYKIDFMRMRQNVTFYDYNQRYVNSSVCCAVILLVK